VVRGIQLPASEVEARLRQELAVGLYSQHILSFGKARELAEMSQYEFGDLIGSRGIPRHYTEADLEADLAYARG
jgi:predicted HTH domain antitoxin